MSRTPRCSKSWTTRQRTCCHISATMLIPLRPGRLAGIDRLRRCMTRPCRMASESGRTKTTTHRSDSHHPPIALYPIPSVLEYNRPPWLHLDLDTPMTVSRNLHRSLGLRIHLRAFPVRLRQRRLDHSPTALSQHRDSLRSLLPTDRSPALQSLRTKIRLAVGHSNRHTPKSIQITVRMAMVAAHRCRSSKVDSRDSPA